MGASGGKRPRIRPIKPAKIDEVRNEINVTPLVDVCLVLLIIFMVIMPMLARGKEVPLPMTRHHSSEKDKLQPIVAVDGSGTVFYDKERVADMDELKERVLRAWEELESRPASAQGDGPVRKVYFKASRDLPYDKIYPVFMALNEIGSGIDLGTNEIKESGK